jgi:hypothetical protein
MNPKILSLVELMRNFEAWKFAELVHDLAQYRWIVYYRKNDGTIDPKVVAELAYTVTQYLEQCQTMDLAASAACIKKRLGLMLRGAYGSMTWEELLTELGVLWDALGPEMSNRRFAYLSDSKAIHVDEMLKRKKSGQQLVNPWAVAWRRFPSAKEDLAEAVYCYALERNIACIFHLMRAAEVGLRGLARRMRVQMPGGKRLEWAEWAAILREMDKKNDALSQTMKAGPVKDETLEFNRGCLGQFYGFKDEFRNQVSHKRKSYDQYQAASVLSHVRDFMRKLSARTDEKGRKLKYEPS